MVFGSLLPVPFPYSPVFPPVFILFYFFGKRGDEGEVMRKSRGDRGIVTVTIQAPLCNAHLIGFVSPKTLDLLLVCVCVCVVDIL